jgi:hypothetical protein
MAHVAAFLVAPFGCCERAWKPFNPLLGETFELEGLGPNKDGRFLAEQVCGAVRTFQLFGAGYGSRRRSRAAATAGQQPQQRSSRSRAAAAEWRQQPR